MGRVATKDEFEKHIREEHHKTTFAEYIKEIIYGGTDGIVTTFAVVAGFTGAQSAETVIPMSVLTVLLFGLANLFADGAAMGLGNFLSLRAEKQVYDQSAKKEWYEIENSEEEEKAETRFLLQEKGFSPEDANTITDLFAKNKPYWHNFMMIYELEANPPEENPALNGIATFLAFIVFGFIPIIPYLLTEVAQTAWLYSCGFTVFALALLGIFSAIITRRKLIAATLESVLVGGTAASIAYFVGTLF